MSFSHWWFSCFLSDTDYRRLLPLASSAEQKAVLQPENEMAFTLWKAHPKEFEQTSVLSTNDDGDKQHGISYNKFIWAFNLPGYDEFGETIIAEDFLSQETCFRFIILNRCSPVAVLWHALGYDRATLLPGKMGNMFLSANHVENALIKVNQALSGINLNMAVERGMRLAGHSNNYQDVFDILTHLPEGLSQALKIRKGFLALARPQL